MSPHGDRGHLNVPLHLIHGTLVAREPWRLQAACRNHPLWVPSTWDDNPDLGREEPKQRKRRIEAAKAVCRGCPVRVECLRDVNWDLDEGVRGGEDLRELRRRLRKKAAS